MGKIPGSKSAEQLVTAVVPMARVFGEGSVAEVKLRDKSQKEKKRFGFLSLWR